MYKILSVTILTSLLALGGQAYAKDPTNKERVKLQEIFEGKSFPVTTKKPHESAEVKKTRQIRQVAEFISQFGINPPDKREALAYARQNKLMGETLFIKFLPKPYYSDLRFQQDAFKYMQKKQRIHVQEEQHKDRMAALRTRLQEERTKLQQEPSVEVTKAPGIDNRTTRTRIKDIKAKLKESIEQEKRSLGDYNL